ncbi:hypothetical protein HPB51_012672 [Rhipicephalus microplus]|uniref:Uncharacterized protein n=1 Tax=Rhipicephalus microplus TaxID=6941 RepID=A0A9J6D4P8_RHIMP|nr:hypothetical protein HPB51_012672 [Rhipicephalus microplus]
MRLTHPEVLTFCGGFEPSVGHGNRIARILRSECHRQTGLYRDILRNHIYMEGGTTNQKKKKWRELGGLVICETERLWSTLLSQLRSKRQPNKPAEDNIIHTTDDVVLPEFLKETLGRGPKYAVEPRLEAPKLLSLVRQLSGCAPDCEKDRCISEGVDVLEKFRPKRQVFPIRKVVTYLKESGICVIPSDKEGLHPSERRTKTASCCPSRGHNLYDSLAQNSGFAAAEAF